MLSQAFQSLVGDLKEKARLVEYMTATAGAAPAEPPRSARPSPPRDALRPGTLFANRYEVKEVLGTGGMGVVYRAFDRELQEPVAIKALRPEALVGSGVALERFKQEIRLARKIAHRNVVRTYDLGEVNGTYYLTMEYVEGDRKSTRLNSSHDQISYAVFCLKKKKNKWTSTYRTPHSMSLLTNIHPDQQRHNPQSVRTSPVS